MGIGRKATDRRTPCRKFLATPLHFNTVWCSTAKYLACDKCFIHNPKHYGKINVAGKGAKADNRCVFAAGDSLLF